MRGTSTPGGYAQSQSRAHGRPLGSSSGEATRSGRQRNHGGPLTAVARRPEVHDPHADVGGCVQDARVPNPKSPPQVATQGDCHRRPTAKNHSVAFNCGPRARQCLRSCGLADCTTSPGRGQGIEGRAPGAIRRTHGLTAKHDATVGPRRSQRRQHVNDADQIPPEDDLLPEPGAPGLPLGAPTDGTTAGMGPAAVAHGAADFGIDLDWLPEPGRTQAMR